MPIPGGSRATRKLSFSVGLVSINALAVNLSRIVGNSGVEGVEGETRRKTFNIRMTRLNRPGTSHFGVLTDSRNNARVITETLAMMRKPHTDCFPTPATFTWQGAGKGTFM